MQYTRSRDVTVMFTRDHTRFAQKRRLASATRLHPCLPDYPLSPRTKSLKIKWDAMKTINFYHRCVGRSFSSADNGVMPVCRRFSKELRQR